MQKDLLSYQRRKILSLLGICFCTLFIIMLCPNTNSSDANNTNIIHHEETGYLTNTEVNNLIVKSSNDYIYLSDIPYVKDKSGSAWKSINLDKASDGNLISVKIEGAYYTFEKGIWAHATSTVVYDLSDYSDYDYFTAYLGLNKTAATSSNGVKFYIYTSNDGNNWDLKTDLEPKVVKAGDNASFVKVNIKGAKYLKLYANDNGSNGNDHSVYADAKLIKESYKDELDVIVKDVLEYDEKIKTQFSNASLDNKDYQLLLLQRQFVNNVGNYALKRFLSESDSNKKVYAWLMNDLDNLRLYVLGGQPAGGSYYNSLNVLSKLYEEYSTDFENTKLLNNKWDPSLTYGDLYKKMAFSISLTHSQSVGLWMQSGNVNNKSEPLRRYAIFKYLHENGKFKATEKVDITPWFESLQVEEMRLVMNNAIDDEEILWLNDYVQSNINKYPNKVWNYLTPHPYMAYVWPNYGNPVYYDEANKEYFNQLFAVNGVGLFDLKYTVPGGKNIKTYELSVTRGTSDNKVQKVWMNFRNKFGTGAVCGGISKSGSNIRTTHGIPAVVIGQPGHAAILYYTKTEQGKGYWSIDNDVSGWSLSEKGERMLNGWGNASYSKGYSVVYMVLAQEALNDFENYQKSQELVMLADVYKGNLSKQESLYEEALKVQSINIDAWYGLINLYLSDKTKTEKDYYDLAAKLAEDLKDFPLPMYHLTNLIKPKLTSVEYSFKFTLLQTRTLTEGSTSTSKKVLQPGVTRVEANYLLGKIDKSLATFSFDGEDAGKIVLSSRFDNTGVRLDYSIDGKKSWKEVSFTAEEEHKVALTSKQLDSITSENDIYVHIVGTSYDDENLYKIDILEQAAPNNIYNNDLENKVIGATNNMQWKMEGTNVWKSFEDEVPDLTGNKVVIVRNKRTGVYLTSAEKTLKYTEDIVDEKRKYVEISHLSIESVSTEATGSGQNGNAKYSIDGNYNTRWHSAWNGSDNDKYIVIKFDKKINISAMDYVPGGGGNGKILEGQILGSIDGKEYTEIAHVTWGNNETIKTVEFENAPEVKYVKIVGVKTSSAGSGSFMSARMFNFYEDTTVIENASIEYSNKELTNQDVIAKLINLNPKFTIVNNKGSNIYTFKENGTFTFELVDENGNKSTEVATVNNIDKVIPTAHVEYSTKEQTKKPVVATLTKESEVITIMNNNGKNTYTFTKNGNFEFMYKDKAGNIGKTLATVNWILSDELDNPIEDDNSVVDTPSNPEDNSPAQTPDDSKDNNTEEKPNNSENNSVVKPGETENNGNESKNPDNTTVEKPNTTINKPENNKVETTINSNNNSKETINENQTLGVITNNTNSNTNVNDNQNQNVTSNEDKSDNVEKEDEKDDIIIEEKQSKNILPLVIGFIIIASLLIFIILKRRKEGNK